MRDKLNQFIENLNGQFVEVSSKEAIYQCMDLAYVWVFSLGFPKATIQNQYAYQVFTAPKDITYQYFDVIANTPNGIPLDGDLVVWKGGTAGHIAIALDGGTTSKFRCFEQNNPLGTNAHIGEKFYTNVLGWLRPKFTNGASWIKSYLSEKSIDISNEGDARGRLNEVFTEAIKFDEADSARKQAQDKLAEANGEITRLNDENKHLKGDLISVGNENIDLKRAVADRDATIYRLQQQIPAVTPPVAPPSKSVWYNRLIELLLSVFKGR